MIRRLYPYLLALAVASLAMFFYSRNLGHEYISQWDEIIHVNVAHNLYANCCVPTLHTEDLGTGFKDWTNNYVWLHKPLLPFYVRAVFFWLFGESLFVFRLSSAIFAVATSLVLFFLAKKLANTWTGTVVALLFATNSYVFELVQGRQFSDFSDILFVFFLSGILWFTLSDEALNELYRESSFKKSIRPFLYVGFLAACAYWSKGGLVLPALSVFAVSKLWQGGIKIKQVFRINYAAALALVIIAPAYWYLFSHFPKEFRYEQTQQVQHLFANVEGWARPWDWYVTQYAKELLDPLLAGTVFFAVGISFVKFLRSRRNILLALWVLAYLVPLSFGVSKVANFLAPAAAAALLLVGCVLYDIWRAKKWEILFAISAPVLALFVLLHFDVFAFSRHVGYDQTIGQRFFLLGVFAGLQAVCFALAWLSDKVAVPIKRISLAVLCLSGAVLLLHNIKTNMDSSSVLPQDYAQQMAVMRIASQIKNQLPHRSVIVVDDSTLVNAFLYVQYWSGFNALPKSHLEFAQKQLSPNHALYSLKTSALKLKGQSDEPSWYLQRLH